jgi:hypothetical protein
MRVLWSSAVVFVGVVSLCAAADPNCASCHPKQTNHYERAAMTQALLRPMSKSQFLGDGMSFVAVSSAIACRSTMGLLRTA